MISIVKIFSFSAAHYLPHHKGSCKNGHGHNYKLEVKITGQLQISGPAQGMIMDFDDLTEIVSGAVGDHDHTNLNTMYTNPTAEVMIKAMAQQIGFSLPDDVKLKSLKLWETEKCYAEWTAD